VVCEPTDCGVVVSERYFGSTTKGRITLDSLAPGEGVIVVFNEGGGVQTREVRLNVNAPLEERFEFSPKKQESRPVAREYLLDVVREIGGVEGSGALGQFEGEGLFAWTDSGGKSQSWSMAFAKHLGKALTVTFKTDRGQCSVLIRDESVKNDCKGKLKNSGESVAGRAATLFLTYQLYDVVQQFINEVQSLSAADGNRLIFDSNSQLYSLTVGADKLPVELIRNSSRPPQSTVTVKYSNYSKVGKALYPTRMAITSNDFPRPCVFMVTTIQSRRILNR
jgi:hypothetical protein